MELTQDQLGGVDPSGNDRQKNGSFSEPVQDKAESRHVVLYIPDFSLGGAERVALNLLESLPTSDMRVTLLVNRETGPLRTQLPCDARMVSLDASRTLAALPRLVRFLRHESPDALISFLSFNNIVSIWARSVSGCKTKVIATIHAPVSFEAGRSSPLHKFWYIPRLYRITLPKADHIVTVSPGVGDDLLSCVSPGLSVSSIGNPIVTEQMLELAKADLEHPWFAPGAPPVILGVGRFVALKNYALLISAFARLATTTPAHLALLGGGPLQQDLQNQIDHLGLTDRAVLLPMDANPYRYMARARVVVLSSLYEGFGNVLVEAMATGTPVVSVDCPFGPAEILGSGKWGRLVSRTATPETLAAAIEATLASTNDVQFIRDRAMEYSSATIAQRYRDLLQRLWSSDNTAGGPIALAKALSG